MKCKQKKEFGSTLVLPGKITSTVIFLYLKLTLQWIEPVSQSKNFQRRAHYV